MALELGAKESSGSNRIYVGLRIGKIAQTLKEPREGFHPAKTVNKAGKETHFFAKAYDELVGYVTGLRWKTSELTDGTVLTGWDVTIDTGDQEFVLHVSSNDRPYQRFMSCLLNVDFSRPVKFVGFMGHNNGKSQKVLLLTQSDKEKDWVQPKYQERWLSQDIVKKLKEKLPLTEQDQRNVAYLSDGKIDGNYPYIKQLSDGKWSADNWNEFLFEKMNEEVLPAIEEANSHRGSKSIAVGQSDGYVAVEEEEDSDIPF
jgi:hypothetical protein